MPWVCSWGPTNLLTICTVSSMPAIKNFCKAEFWILPDPVCLCVHPTLGIFLKVLHVDKLSGVLGTKERGSTYLFSKLKEEILECRKRTFSTIKFYLMSTYFNSEGYFVCFEGVVVTFIIWAVSMDPDRCGKKTVFSLGERSPVGNWPGNDIRTPSGHFWFCFSQRGAKVTNIFKILPPTSWVPYVKKRIIIIIMPSGLLIKKATDESLEEEVSQAAWRHLSHSWEALGSWQTLLCSMPAPCLCRRIMDMGTAGS